MVLDATLDLLERLDTDDDIIKKEKRHPGMVLFDVEEVECRAGKREPGENALAARYVDKLKQ